MRTKIEEREWIKWPVKNRLLEETKGKCAHCGTHIERGDNLTLEHFIPLNKGGINDEENLTVLCYECNQLKSDMILPVSWYTYLSTNKKNIFKGLIHKYLTEVDYLAEDCVLMVDVFRIRVFIPMQQKLGSNGYRTLGMPVNIDFIRMTRNDAFNWLMKYKTSLEWRDMCGTIKHPKEWHAPCYILKKAEKEIAMVCPSVIHQWDDDIKNYFNEIVFDWYFSPDLPNKDYIPKMLADLVKATEAEVITTLASTLDDAAIIAVSFRCFISDRFCNQVFDMIDRPSRILEFPTHYHMNARVRELFALQFVGDKNKALIKMMTEEESKGRSISELVRIAMNNCEAFNKRFEK